MNDREALYRTICDRPGDDVPRLVFADWLQENGEDDRAEFIRVQCRLAELGPGDPDYYELRDRERELFLRGARQWRSDLPRMPHFGWPPAFEGGFPSELAFPDEDEPWDGDSHEVLNYVRVRVPIRSLSLPMAREQWVERVLSWPELDQLSGLRLIFPANHDRYALFRAIAKAAQIGGLTRLDTGYLHSHTGDLFRIVCESDSFPNLTDLTFQGNGVGTEFPFAPLIDSSLAERLRSFRVQSVRLTPENARSFRSAHFPNLQTLEIRTQLMTPEETTSELLARESFPTLRVIRTRGFRFHPRDFAALGEWNTLTELHLSLAGIGTAGAKVLAATSGFSRLRVLRLPLANLTARGIEHLASSPYLANLRELDLRDNVLSKAGLRALSRSEPLQGLQTLRLSARTGQIPSPRQLDAFLSQLRLPHLRTLELQGLPLGREGATVIAESSKFTNLRELSLNSCQLGDEGVVALIESTNLSRLLHLDVTDNQIHKGLARLADPSRLPELRRCTRGANPLSDQSEAALRERFGEETL